MVCVTIIIAATAAADAVLGRPLFELITIMTFLLDVFITIIIKGHAVLIIIIDFHTDNGHSASICTCTRL